MSDRLMNVITGNAQQSSEGRPATKSSANGLSFHRTWNRQRGRERKRTGRGGRADAGTRAVPVTVAPDAFWCL